MTETFAPVPETRAVHLSSPRTAVAWLVIVLLLAVGCGDDTPEVTALGEYSRGLDLQQSGKLDRADEAYREAIHLDPNLAPAHAGRGYVYFARRDYPQALGYLERAIELDPQLAIADHYRRRGHFTNDEPLDALLNLTRAIQLEPDSPRFHLERAQLHLLNDDSGPARANLEQVLSLTQDETWLGPAHQLLAAISESR